MNLLDVHDVLLDVLHDVLFDFPLESSVCILSLV